MFNLNKIRHIHDVSGYSKEDLFKLITGNKECHFIEQTPINQYSFDYKRYIYYSEKSDYYLRFAYRHDGSLNYISTYKNFGNICPLVYKHNEEGIPDQISYSKSGLICVVSYRFKENYHNPFGPAYICYRHYFKCIKRRYVIKGTIVSYEGYYLKGLKHNSVGYAIKEQSNLTGNPWFYYCLNGKTVSKSEVLNRLSKKLEM